MDISGIHNSDWFVTLFADGHQSAVDPNNPDIVYAEWQQGNLTRVDRKTGEITYIRPQAKEGDPPERYNWDSPILISSHDSKTLFFGTQRVWRSDDYGDSWTAISGDITRNEKRTDAPLMGRTWSFDAPWDLFAMSMYNTITSLSESPLVAGLVYAGTDDGLIQVSENNGQTWRKIDKLPGVPKRFFVNDIKADLFDPDTVYFETGTARLFGISKDRRRPASIASRGIYVIRHLMPGYRLPRAMITLRAAGYWSHPALSRFRCSSAWTGY